LAASPTDGLAPLRREGVPGVGQPPIGARIRERPEQDRRFSSRAPPRAPAF
jgi:hypothetical protein